MDADLTKHFKTLELRKKRNRLRYIRNFLFGWSIVALLALMAYALWVNGLNLLYGWFLLLAIIAGLIEGLVSIDTLLPKMYSPLGVLDSAFVKAYKALEALDLSNKDASKDSQKKTVKLNRRLTRCWSLERAS